MGESSNIEKCKEMMNRPASDEMLQRRFKNHGQVLKNRRELAVDKGRNIEEEEIDSLLDDVEMMDIHDDENDNEKMKKKSLIGDQWRQLLESSKVSDQHNGLFQISKAINKKPKAVVKELIKHNLVARIIQLLETQKDRITQLNCIEILIDASSCNVKEQVPLTIINTLELILTAGTDEKCQLHSVALLGNLTCESVELRNEIATSGIVPYLLESLPNAQSKMTANITWFLSNFLAGKGLIHSRETILRIIKALKTTIYHENDDVLEYSCWALRQICSAEKSNIDIVIEAGCCSQLIELMFSFSKEVSIAAISAVGEIVKGGEVHMQAALDGDVLPQIKSIFKQTDEIKAHALWLISNIAAGSPSQIQRLIESGILPDALNLLSPGDEPMKYEIAWIVLNMLNKYRVNQSQIEYVVSIGWIPATCKLLESTHEKILTLALKAMRAILDLGNIEYINQLGECGGFALINNLQSHSNEHVIKAVAEVVLQFQSLQTRGLIIQQ